MKFRDLKKALKDYNFASSVSVFCVVYVEECDVTITISISNVTLAFKLSMVATK